MKAPNSGRSLVCRTHHLMGICGGAIQGGRLSTGAPRPAMIRRRQSSIRRSQPDGGGRETARFSGQGCPGERVQSQQLDLNTAMPMPHHHSAEPNGQDIRGRHRTPEGCLACYQKGPWGIARINPAETHTGSPRTS